MCEKWNEVAYTVQILHHIDFCREIPVEKSLKDGECGSLDHLLFLSLHFTNAYHSHIPPPPPPFSLQTHTHTHTHKLSYTHKCIHIHLHTHIYAHSHKSIKTIKYVLSCLYPSYSPTLQNLDHKNAHTNQPLGMFLHSKYVFVLIQ